MELPWYYDVILLLIIFWIAVLVRSCGMEVGRLRSLLIKRTEEAYEDGVTELPNMRHLSILAEHMYAELHRASLKRITLVYVDLDKFKPVNDLFGHLAGNEVLRTFASILRANMRKVDVAARPGGDEFVLLLEDATADEAGTVLRRVRNQFETYAFPFNKDLSGQRIVHVSFTYAIVSSDEIEQEKRTFRHMHDEADRRMNVRKRKKGSRDER